MPKGPSDNTSDAYVFTERYTEQEPRPWPPEPEPDEVFYPPWMEANADREVPEV